MPFVKVGDCNLHYEVVGEGPPMLWLHGFTSCGKFWLDLAPRVPGRHILVDARGHGYSDPSAEKVIPPSLMAEDAVKVMDALGVGRAVVLGHSMGGTVAQEIALRHPGRVAGLVLVGTIPSVPEMGWKGRFLGSRALKYGRFLGRRIFRFFMRRFEPMLTREQADFVMDHYYRSDFLTLHRIGRGMRTFDALSRLGQIGCPTAVIVGAEDKLTPPDRNEQIHRSIPGSHFVKIPGTGHGCPIEKPAEFVDAVRSLVARVTSR